MANTFRCVICDGTNNTHAVTPYGKMIFGDGRSFFEDPHNKFAFICYQCREEIEDAKQDFVVLDKIQKEFK